MSYTGREIRGDRFGFRPDFLDGAFNVSVKRLASESSSDSDDAATGFCRGSNARMEDDEEVSDVKRDDNPLHYFGLENTKLRMRIAELERELAELSHRQKLDAEINGENLGDRIEQVEEYFTNSDPFLIEERDVRRLESGDVVVNGVFGCVFEVPYGKEAVEIAILISSINNQTPFFRRCLGVIICRENSVAKKIQFIMENDNTRYHQTVPLTDYINFLKFSSGYKDQFPSIFFQLVKNCIILTLRTLSSIWIHIDQTLKRLNMYSEENLEVIKNSLFNPDIISASNGILLVSLNHTKDATGGIIAPRDITIRVDLVSWMLKSSQLDQGNPKSTILCTIKRLIHYICYSSELNGIPFSDLCQIANFCEQFLSSDHENLMEYLRKIQTYSIESSSTS